MEAPEIGPANIASSAIKAPTAIPAMAPFSFEPVETHRITSIRIQVRINSMRKDCAAPSAGSVAPRVGWLGNIRRSIKLASNAPAH